MLSVTRVGTDNDEQVLVHELLVLSQTEGSCNMIENEQNNSVRSSKLEQELICHRSAKGFKGYVTRGFPTHRN